MAKYYEYEEEAARRGPSEGEELVKRWIQALGKLTGPVKRAGVQELLMEIRQHQAD